MSERVYELRVDDVPPVTLTEGALMSAWRGAVPDIALQIRALGVGCEMSVSAMPHILVMRLS